MDRDSFILYIKTDDIYKVWANFNFYYSSAFCLYQQKNLFWEEDWALVYNSMTFWDFPDLS